MHKQLKLDGVVIDVVFKKVRTMCLSVHPPDGQVRLSAPHRMDPDVVKAFAVSKLPWIKKHRERLMEQARLAPRAFVDGEHHSLFGRQYALRVMENRKAGAVRLNGSTIEMHTRKNTSVAGRQRIMSEWYRRELKKIIPGLIQKWETRIGVSASGFGIKSMKTRWGSCNRRTGMIWLNLELARRPVIYLEYVIVHELVHLLERHHNDTFKKYMDEFMPEWRRYRREMNRVIAQSDM